MLGDEGYTLSVTTKNIIIKANKPAGIFYGVQSLMQLFPAEILDSSLVKNIEWKAAMCRGYRLSSFCMERVNV